MRPTVVTAAAYLALMTAWVYGVLDRYESGVEWLLPLVAILQFAAGFASGRWYLVPLPLAVVLISVPAGYPPVEGGEPFPLWFGLAFGALFAIPLVVAGVLARKLYERWPPRSASPHENET